MSDPVDAGGRSRRRWRTLVAVAGLLVTISHPHPVTAQQVDTTGPEAACWRFAFGTWTPPLDWNRSGHAGKAGDLADRIQRVRDSVFVKDTSATRNNAMFWERTPKGPAVVLYPPWWPVGLRVEFDSVLAGGREMTGVATAFVADAAQQPSRARARAVRCPG